MDRGVEQAVANARKKQKFFASFFQKRSAFFFLRGSFTA